MITVMGATGHTGGQIAAQLLAAGQPVRAVSRSASRLAALADAGAEPIVGDANDPGFLTGAFRGADAVYTLVPFDPTWPRYHEAVNRLGGATLTAIRDSGVPHVVFLSAVGADRPARTGFIASLHRQEQRLRQLTDTNVLVLRAGMFFESFLTAVDLIRAEGVNGDSVAPDVPIPMIATADIADVAATALGSPDWTGFVVRELLGQRDLSYREVTSILGTHLGIAALQYVQFSEADVVQALVDAGLSADVARLIVEMNRALSDGTIRSLEGRQPANTTPTRFEDFAGQLGRIEAEGRV